MFPVAIFKVTNWYILRSESRTVLTRGTLPFIGLRRHVTLVWPKNDTTHVFGSRVTTFMWENTMWTETHWYDLQNTVLVDTENPEYFPF